MAELPKQYKIHPNMVTKWKREGLEGMTEIFRGSRSGGGNDQQEELKTLQAKIGELRLLALVSLAPKPNTSRPKPGHPVYP